MFHHPNSGWERKSNLMVGTALSGAHPPTQSYSQYFYQILLANNSNKTVKRLSPCPKSKKLLHSPWHIRRLLKDAEGEWEVGVKVADRNARATLHQSNRSSLYLLFWLLSSWTRLVGFTRGRKCCCFGPTTFSSHTAMNHFSNKTKDTSEGDRDTERGLRLRPTQSFFMANGRAEKETVNNESFFKIS